MGLGLWEGTPRPSVLCKVLSTNTLQATVPPTSRPGHSLEHQTPSRGGIQAVSIPSFFLVSVFAPTFSALWSLPPALPLSVTSLAFSPSPYFYSSVCLILPCGLCPTSPPVLSEAALAQ